ncbi:MAG TPA: site-2 protease family protein [Candidatus Paceibacterota bacterium]
MSIVIFIIILLVLVLVHEFGHFFSAKKFGIKVEEFGFGFPPKLFGIKKEETEYTFNLLPLGGFVKIFGENPDDENTKGPEANRSFVNKPKWQQAVVLFAGVFANFLLAWLLFSVGFMSGLPTSAGSEPAGYQLSDVHLIVVSVAPDSPAENAGLKTGDKINSVLIPESSNSADFIQNPTALDLQKLIAGRGSQDFNLAINYTRAGAEDMVIMKPALVDGKQHIGISMDMIGTAKLPFFRALLEGARLDWHVTKGTAVGLYTLITEGIQGKGDFATIAGPVGMVGIVGDAYEFGFVYLLSFAALISVNLGIINLIPFPALDGGRLLFLLIEKIKGSRINPKTSNALNMAGFFVLILLMVIVTYHDVVKLF